jgi:hypothetical protein
VTTVTITDLTSMLWMSLLAAAALLLVYLHTKESGK